MFRIDNTVRYDGVVLRIPGPRHRRKSVRGGPADGMRGPTACPFPRNQQAENHISIRAARPDIFGSHRQGRTAVLHDLPGKHTLKLEIHRRLWVRSKFDNKRGREMLMRLTAKARVAAILLALPSTTALAQPKLFDAGKVISLSTFTPPGGSYDTYLRLLARHMGKYIPGAPRLIVLNQPGAGGNRGLELRGSFCAKGRHLHDTRRCWNVHE